MMSLNLKNRFFFITTTFSCIVALFLTSGISNAHAQGPVTTAAKLKNPLGVNSIVDLLEALLAVVVVLATPIIVFFIIYSGFLYVTARGNSAKVEEATKSLTYAVIGGVLVLGAFAIAQIVKSLVGSFLP